jgi:hypothetical protein
MSSGGSLRQIYNLLLAGKKLNMDFADATAAETFRVRMHKYKKVQDTAMMKLGMISEDERQAFVFTYDAESGFARMYFGERAKPVRTYSFTVED